MCVSVVARCQMWVEMLEVRQIDMEDFFTPRGLHRYTGVWRMRQTKHCRVNQSESEKFLHSWEFRNGLNFSGMILYGIFRLNERILSCVVWEDAKRAIHFL